MYLFRLNFKIRGQLGWLRCFCFDNNVITLGKKKRKVNKKKFFFVYHVKKLENQGQHMDYKKSLSTTWKSRKSGLPHGTHYLVSWSCKLNFQIDHHSIALQKNVLYRLTTLINPNADGNFRLNFPTKRG